MSRLDILLLFILIACALSAVNATNQQRQIFIDLEQSQSHTRRLQQDYAQLQYQQSALSKTSRIENVAVSQLKMQPVTSGRTQYLRIDPALVSVSDNPASSTAAADAVPGVVASTATASSVKGTR